MHTYQPGNQDHQVKLTDDGLKVGKRPGNYREGDDVAIAYRGDGREAEVGEHLLSRMGRSRRKLE